MGSHACKPEWGKGEDVDGAEEMGVISSVNVMVSLVLSSLQREKGAGASRGVQECKDTGGG